MLHADMYICIRIRLRLQIAILILVRPTALGSAPDSELDLLSDSDSGMASLSELESDLDSGSYWSDLASESMSDSVSALIRLRNWIGFRTKFDDFCLPPAPLPFHISVLPNFRFAFPLDFSFQFPFLCFCP